MDKFTSSFSSINKSFGQMRQAVSEKLGTADDITDLPVEYKELERKVDALRTIYTNLLYVTNIYTDSSYDYPNQLQDTVVGLTRNVGEFAKVLTQPPAERIETEPLESSSTATTTTPLSPSQQQQSKTLPHALSRAASEGAQLFGSNEPLGIALDKFAITQERVGEQRVKMDQEISKKFVQPFNKILNTHMQSVMKARKNVQSTRLALDAAKATYKTIRPERSEAARLEVEQAEDQFVAAVEEATILMKAVLDTPEHFRYLSDLVNAQLAFHKEAFEIFGKLAPEIDDIHIAQETLYRNSHND